MYKLQKLLPGPALTMCFLILPIVASIYFIVTKYSGEFIVEQDVTYLDVQANWIGQILLEQKWLDWFNRFMDFALWGILAAVVLIGAWAAANTKTVLKNHYAQVDFSNFQENKRSWHTHFFVIFSVRVVLLIIVAFLLISIIGRLVPHLSAQISLTLLETNLTTIIAAFKVAILLFIYQYLSAAAIKLFRALRME